MMHLPINIEISVSYGMNFIICFDTCIGFFRVVYVSRSVRYTFDLEKLKYWRMFLKGLSSLFTIVPKTNIFKKVANDLIIKLLRIKIKCVYSCINHFRKIRTDWFQSIKFSNYKVLDFLLNLIERKCYSCI